MNWTLTVDKRITFNETHELNTDVDSECPVVFSIKSLYIMTFENVALAANKKRFLGRSLDALPHRGVANVLLTCC